MESLAETLATHGITDLSEDSLIAALLNSNPQVRAVAAMKLDEDRHDDAVPAIESALSREQDVNAQIGLAQALIGLHDDKGVAHLHSMCTDASLNFMTLVRVVDALGLNHLQAGVCAETFFSAMSRSKEPGEIAMGASRLAVIYRDATPEQALRITTTLRLLLADDKQEPSVRMEASRGLGDIGTPECLDAIRIAITHEQDLNVRGFFDAILKGSQRNPH